jgi:prepilin-type N-terminal cleavage/methylation domain-containing protein
VPTRPPKRRGFTLIELLVVIAIIAILVALLLPAVQQVREAARKTQCSDHLHNLAIALHGYEGSYKMLPKMQYRHTQNANGWEGHGPWVSILPYIEQKPLYDRWNFNVDYRAAANSFAHNSKIDVFLCPSDREYPAAAPGNNYAASAGSTINLWSTARGNGWFSRDREVRFAEVTDGTSNVVLLGELLTGDDSQNQTSDSDVVNHSANPPSSVANRNFATSAELEAIGLACNALPTSAQLANSQCGRAWSSPYPANTAFSTSAPPNWKYRTCMFGGGFGACADRDGIVPARSRHPGGAQVSMGDAKVRFVSENVDTLTWQRAGARNDGQPTGSF